jgi:UrcA family protein
MTHSITVASKRGTAAALAMAVTGAIFTMFASSTIAGAPDGRVLLTSDGVRTVAVHYGDLNLQSDAGNAALFGRLRQAAERVCGTDDSRNLSVRNAVRECKRDAVARAVEQVGSVRLAALVKRSPVG